MLTTLPLSNGSAAFRDSGAGEPLVLIHGVGLQSAAWGPQIADLSTTYRVIAVDMPGHGGSDPLAKDAGLAAFVGWAAELIEALDLGAVNLAGHSMGALIAQGVAVSRPELVRRVALLNGVYRRNHRARVAVAARAAQIARGQMDVTTPLARWFGDTPAERAAHTQTEEWLRAVNIAHYATAYAAFSQGDDLYADGLRGVTCPFLALTGDGDLNSTPQMARDMAHTAANGHAIIVEGHRHMVNMTAPELVSAHLRDWLTRPQEHRIAS